MQHLFLILNFGIKISVDFLFWVYAMHNLLGPCLEKSFLLIGPKGNIGALLNTFVISVINVMLCVGIALLCRKNLPQVYYILSGGRGAKTINNTK